MLELGPQLKGWGRTDADWIVFVFARAFGVAKRTETARWALLLSKAGVTSVLAREMLFSSQFPVVDVGSVWMVKETFFLSLC